MALYVHRLRGFNWIIELLIFQTTAFLPHKHSFVLSGERKLTNYHQSLLLFQIAESFQNCGYTPAFNAKLQ